MIASSDRTCRISTKSRSDMNTTESAICALEIVASAALKFWDLPQDARPTLVNRAENSTFIVEAAGMDRRILRLHRKNYHSLDAIRSELAWTEALRASGTVVTPKAIPGRDGCLVQVLRNGPASEPRYLAMFEFVEGRNPDEEKPLDETFEWLGETSGRLHRHASAWERPRHFTRPTWDCDAVFGRNPKWGRWQDAPNISADAAKLMARAQDEIERRLGAFGKAASRYGLIHADMRLANLLASRDQTALIDFDDCGFGWHLYDFAASVSFIEDNPQVPALKQAWITGYRRIRPLSEAEAMELDTFILFRRLALLAWVGSHAGDATEATALAPDFAQGTAGLAESYLRRFG